MTRPPHIEVRLQRDMAFLLHQCQTMGPESQSIELMGTAVPISFAIDVELQSLIEQAFFSPGDPASTPQSDYALSVFDKQSLMHAPDLSWYSPRDAVVRSAPCGPLEWLIYSDSSSGVTTIIFPEHQRIAILLRRIPELDPRAFITPFRIAIAWIVRHMGGSVLHAAAVTRDGLLVAVAGPSGSGKSTLARALCEDGWQPIADDAINYRDGFVLPIYRRLKWYIPDDPAMERLAHGKSFVTMSESDVSLRHPRKLTAVVFPIVSARFGISLLQRDEAQRALSTSSLSEIAGGFGGEDAIYSDVCSHVPTFRVSLDPDIQLNARSLGHYLR